MALPTVPESERHQEQTTPVQPGQLRGRTTMSKARGPYRVDPLGHKKKADEALNKKAENARELALAEQPAQQEPVPWPAGLIERIKSAEQRIQDGHAPRRIPADPTDVDLVLAEVRYLLEGKQPPFWVNTSPPAQQEPVTPTAVEVKNAAANLALMREMWGNADEPVAKVNDDGFIVETGLLLSPGTKLYTSPPAQRTWVGLTEEEMHACWDSPLTPLGMKHVRMIEAKLKEKNQ